MKTFTILKCSIFAMLVALCALSNQARGQSNTPTNQDVSVKSESYEYAYSISNEEMAAMEADRIFERGYAYKKKASLSPQQQKSKASEINMRMPTQKCAILRQTVRMHITQKSEWGKI